MGLKKALARLPLSPVNELAGHIRTVRLMLYLFVFQHLESAVSLVWLLECQFSQIQYGPPIKPLMLPALIK